MMIIMCVASKIASCLGRPLTWQGWVDQLIKETVDIVIIFRAEKENHNTYVQDDTFISL